MKIRIEYRSWELEYRAKMLLFAMVFILSSISCLLTSTPTHAAINISPKVGPTACATGLSCGLVGYWTFDGKDTPWTSATAATTLDKSGHYATGTLTNMNRATSTVAGKIGQALKFDGVNSYVDAGTSPVLDPGTGNMTYSAWIKTSVVPTDSTNWQEIVGKNACQPLRIGTGGIFYPYVANSDNSVNRVITGTRVVTDGKWHHLVFVSDYSGSSKIYVDGVADGSANNNYNGLAIADSGYALNIGRYNLGRYFSGLIDDVRIYNRALSANEVTQLYKIGAGDKVSASPKVGNTACTTGLSCGLVGYWTFDGKDTPWTSAYAGTTLDKSGNNYTGTLTKMGRATSTAAGKIGQALKFDGVNSYVDLGTSVKSYISKDSTFTISAWFNTKSIASAIDGPTILCSSMSASDRTAIQIYNGYLSVATYNGTAYTKKSVAFSSLNKWNHIVMINSGGVVSGYLNGVSMTGSVGPNTSTPNKTYIGTDSYGFFNGSLDDVRIYSRALSANEITQLYKIGAGDKVAASPKVGPTACTTGLSCGLVGYWTFDGKDTPWTSAYAGTTLDKSGKNNTGTLTNMGRATSTTVGKIGQALKFNGKNSHVDIGDPADGSLDFGTNSFSYGLWVYATGNYGEYDMPWYKNGASAGGTGYDMELGSYGWQADVSDGTNIVSATFLASGIYNKWTHLFVVVNRSTGRLLTYVNGSIANGAGNDISTMGSFSTGIGARIGAGYLMRNPFLGKIDDVRVYNRALSAAEVRQLYNLGK